MGVGTPAVEMHRPSSPIARLAGGLDIVLVVVAAIVVIALGGPVLGALVGAGAWLLQRLVAVVDRRWADGMRTPRQQVTVGLFERFGRIWLLAGAIVAAGLIGGRPDGLTAALFVFAAYTVVFVITLFSGPPPERESAA